MVRFYAEIARKLLLQSSKIRVKAGAHVAEAPVIGIGKIQRCRMGKAERRPVC
jgi:hypothetical protein